MSELCLGEITTTKDIKKAIMQHIVENQVGLRNHTGAAGKSCPQNCHKCIFDKEVRI